MATPKETLWAIEPHTKAKHEILKRYLEAWFPILNKYHGKIIYIDGFCGPGKYIGGELGSPLIALNVAATHRKAITGEIIFWFIDSRPDRIEHLKKELSSLSYPSHFKIIPHLGKFHEIFGAILEQLEKDNSRIAPTFAFVDPFGFSGIPYSLISGLLKHSQCEVLITFMVDSINRWLEHPDSKILEHITEAFGTEDALNLIQKPGKIDRIQELRSLYQNQLKKLATFVRYFEMRDFHNKPIYYLFFASNHRLGNLKFKEAMWKIDPGGEFRFSDATDPNQMVLFEADHTSQVLNLLMKGFKGKKNVSCEEIKLFVEDHTPFLEKHMRSALKIAETSGRIEVMKQKADGKKRKINTFPDNAIITFV